MPVSAPAISLCLAASFLHLHARLLSLPTVVSPSLSYPMRRKAGFGQVQGGRRCLARASIPTPTAAMGGMEGHRQLGYLWMKHQLPCD